MPVPQAQVSTTDGSINPYNIYTIQKIYTIPDMYMSNPGTTVVQPFSKCRWLLSNLADRMRMTTTSVWSIKRRVREN